MRPHSKVCWFAPIAFGILTLSVGAKPVHVVLVGEQITDRLMIHSPYIFAGSDSLRLNGRLLRAEQDYRFVSGGGYFDFRQLRVDTVDTLRIVYEPVPNWLSRSWGRSLDPHDNNSAPKAISTNPAGRLTGSAPFAGGVSITGAKSFRFSSRSSGGSGFGQTLDLRLTGEPAKGVQVEGSVSDRGFNAAYGTANSRLSELDRVHLKLRSSHVTAQVGDITIRRTNLTRRPKVISGASLELTYPSWHLEAAAARPRGRYKSAAFQGSDNVQGPYQVGDGARGEPIVPGSETVWLDGERLERGANKDYTIDYPAGQITFNVNHSVDERSRFEIDYEPQNTNYKMELFSSGAGIELSDSSLFLSIGILSEGDDKAEPVGAELSDADKALLASSGERTATRSGVTVDSITGAYDLVADSLPDSVFMYIGAGEGNYRITFSFLGEGQGTYRFLGNDVYQYAGPGGGAYSPIVIIPAPQRLTEYRLRSGIRSSIPGALTFDFRATRFDQNLLSSLDDSDNDGVYYELSDRKNWLWGGQPNSLRFRHRRRGEHYRERERTNRLDFARIFFLPEKMELNRDEILNEVDFRITPGAVWRIDGSAGRLTYQDRFRSNRGTVRLTSRLSSAVSMTAGWTGVRSDLASDSGSAYGRVQTVDAGSTVLLPLGIKWREAYQFDRRENNYATEKRGTRYHQLRSSIGGASEVVEYDIFREDTLKAGWTRDLTRQRLAVRSARRSGYLGYHLNLTYQWLDRVMSRDNSFLSRLSLRYDNPVHRLNLSASYALSEELRSARGITYLEVPQGEGDFTKDNGTFVPDPDGNYIKLEELLSGKSAVRRGEKGFTFSKDWRIVLARFTSSIEEELLPDGSRDLWWVVPFYSDENQPYQFYARRYDAELRALPIRGFHAVNVLFTQSIEKRAVASLRPVRRENKGTVSFKQALRNLFLEEWVDMFSTTRDSYFAGGGKASGFKSGLTIRRTWKRNELSGGVVYRFADNASQEQSRQYRALVDSRISILARGELRLGLEVYSQDLTGVTGAANFQLTDNHPGRRGAIWSAALNYGVRGETRVNISISGRHAANRVARVTARGEVVTVF